MSLSSMTEGVARVVALAGEIDRQEGEGVQRIRFIDIGTDFFR